MDLGAVLRCVVAAILAFAIVAILVLNLLGGGTFVVGLAALVAPLAGAAVGSWQARAGGARRPAPMLALAAVVAALLGLWIFGTNETTDDTLNTLQPILAVVGAVVGAVGYGARWFGSTSSL